MKASTKRLNSLAAALLAVAIGTAACGSGSSSSETPPADTSGASAPADAPEEATSPDAGSDLLAADTSLAPVKIGLIAQDEELFSFPEVRAASQAVVDYLNAEKGGIDGHPVELDVCGAGDAPESHVACAQEMVNADDVHFVVNSGVGVTTAASNALLSESGKAVSTVGNDLTDYTLPGVYVFDPGFLGITQVTFVSAAQQGITDMTLFMPDDPAFAGFVPVLQSIAADNGINLDDVILLGLEPDLTGPMSAANADADAWFLGLGDPAQCASAATAVKTLDYQGVVVTNDVCLNPELIQSGEIDGWSGSSSSTLPTTSPDADVADIVRVLDEYGTEQAITGGFAGWAVAQILIAADALSQAGGADATDASVIDVMNTYSSSAITGFPPVSCPGAGAFFGACNQAMNWVTVEDGAITQGEGFVPLDFTKLEFLLGG